jgi:hypothetical protein
MRRPTEPNEMNEMNGIAMNHGLAWQRRRDE